MNKNLAIRGHLRRGDEVIKILEMFGGKISKECGYKDGYDSSYIFFINTDENSYIDGLFLSNNEELKKYYIFTLEEFLGKFPYKVGDKVSSKYLKNYKIEKMEWENTNNRVIYKLQGMGWYAVNELQPYKEETMEKVKDNWAKWDLPDGYEFQDKDGNIINTSVIKLVKKQPHYPKTYEECCDILYIETNRTIEDDDCLGYRDITQYDINLLTQLRYFRKLLICRDAYWKIAGEQMGLNEPWKPDWTDSNFKYCLKKMGDNIEKSSEMTISCILAFPTEEIRDIFYNNFKNTIEQCKELL